MTKLRVASTGVLLFFASALLVGGCGDSARSTRSSGAPRRTERRQSNTVALVNAVAKSLNNLPAEVVEELLPPVKILDDSTSADGKEVLATCDRTPGVPEGSYNYLEVPKGNANFRTLRVRQGDVVRYFVATANAEDAEHGFGEITYLELTVRRLDKNNPQNAFIVEGGLNQPVLIPARIEVWRFSDKRMNEIRVRLNRYVRQRKPAIGWEPGPDETALELLIERTNQWLRNVPPDDQWQLDPLVEQLPDELRESKAVVPLIAAGQLAEGPFKSSDGRLLQQAIWLRDIAAWAKGEAFDEIDVATALFDWTVRNVQLDADTAADVIHHPWQALMYGHGTGADRAWVFAELCRQEQLDVVMLAIAPSADGPARWWLPALVSDGQLFLFDTQLGLPIPGSELGKVATLAELVAEPDLLRRLDLDSEQTYSVTDEDLKHVEVQLVATPLQLSRRAGTLQSALTGDDFVVLAVDNRRIREALEKISNVAAVRLWRTPLESIVDETTMDPPERLEAAARFGIFAQLPKLWKARVLHFQGTKEIPVDQRDDPLAQPQRGHRDATHYYQNPRIRPSDRLLNRLEPAKQLVYRRAKNDASYWLGLLSFDLGKYRVAADWLRDRTLQAAPEGPWTAGASYNLARAYEALGRMNEAIALLESIESPQRHGNLIRARMLQQRLKEQAGE